MLEPDCRDFIPLRHKNISEVSTQITGDKAWLAQFIPTVLDRMFYAGQLSSSIPNWENNFFNPKKSYFVLWSSVMVRQERPIPY